VADPSRLENPAPPAAPRLAFGPFVLDSDGGQLLEGDRTIPLAPKPFETLQYLVRHPGRVIPKSELMEQLWPGTYVTDDVLVQCVVDIRRALGDDARSPRYVRTVPRRGYRFDSPVRPVGPGALPDASPAAEGASTSVSAPDPRRRAIRLALGVLGAAALALGVQQVWSRLGPAPVAAPDPVSAEPGSLLVLPLRVEEPREESAWLRQGLAEMLRAALGQLPGVRVVARERVASALGALKLRADEGLAAADAGRLARALGAQRVLSGSYVRVEDRFVLTAEILDGRSGAAVGTASARGRHPSDVLDAVDELSLRLAPQLVPSESGLAAGWRPTRLTTRSVDASRLYVEALTAFTRGGRSGADEAEARLAEARRLDPAFGQAYVMTARIQLWRQQWGYDAPDPRPAITEAARFADRLPERERLLVRSFEALVVREDPGAAFALWESLLQLYPTYAEEAGVPGFEMEALQRLGRWDDVIRRGEAHLASASLPDSERARVSSALALAFRRKGEFEPARKHALRAVSLWPEREGPELLRQRTLLGRMSLEAGQREAALAEYRAVRDSPAADATNLTETGWGLYMAGESEAARQVVDRAIELEPAYGNAYHLRGWLDLASGDAAAAARSLEAAFERTPRRFGNPHQGLVGGDVAALYYAGVAYRQLGEEARARQVFRRVMTFCREQLARSERRGEEASRWQAASFLARAAARLGVAAPEPPRLQGDDTTYFVQTARLRAVRGEREAALDALGRGLALGHGELRHVADDPDFESLRDDPEFRRLTAGAPGASGRAAAR
jgi:DNA-binding winged helix-turn-helix (wHTH) protein/tetratricopeptide (TPR) repeat protein